MSDDLKCYTTLALRTELERRENIFDFTTVISMCQKYVDCLDDGNTHVDAEHDIFEEAMCAVFGREVLDWIDQKLSDNGGDNLPEGFNVGHAKACLIGNGRGVLTVAFEWACTPQGFDFWLGEMHRLSDGYQMTQEAREALEGWVRIAEEGKLCGYPYEGIYK